MVDLNFFYNHNLLLVTLSIITSIITSFSAVYLLSIVIGLKGRPRMIWYILSACILGLGIWSMHYIGMLAIVLPHSNEYRLLHVLFTLAISVLFSFMALFIIIVKKAVKFRLFLSALMMGVGISITHYVGMTSMSAHYNMTYSPLIYSSGTLFACVFSSLSFRVFVIEEDITMIKIMKSGIYLGIAISGLHYLAMGAATMEYSPTDGGKELHPIISSTFLGIGLELIIVLIVIILLITAKIDRKFADQADLILLNEQYYKSLYEENPDTIFTLNLEGEILKANQAFTSLFGYTIDELVNKTIIPFIIPEDIERATSYFNKVVAGKASNFNCNILDGTGNQRRINVSLIPIFVEKNVSGVYSIVKDISEFDRAQKNLIEAESKYRTLVENSLVGVYILQEEKIVYINPYLCEMLGYSCGELMKMQLSEYIFPEDLAYMRTNIRRRLNVESHATYVYRAIKKDKKLITFQVYGSKILYNGKDAVIGIVIDVTEREKNERMIKYLAYHDQLTNLPNRNRFYEKLYELIDSSKIQNNTFALLFIDLDQFKAVNDSMGHVVGDQLLGRIADIMKDCISGDEMISRHGGDEFAILLPNSNEERAITTAKNILGVLSEPIVIAQYELVITPSIGIVVFPKHGDNANTLLKNADMAMYYAKSKGDLNYKLFTKELMLQSQNKVELDMSLRKALERKEFSLHYQPQYDLVTKRMIGVEALIRWNHPEKGMIPPVDFIPYAEESGLIIPLGEWVIREACYQNKIWQQCGYPAITISVNLSPKQFQSNIGNTIKKILSETGLEAKYLELEITENITMEVELAISTLKKLKKLGVKISIDDFGTGYSSLYYLKKLPIDKLKIDQSFILGIVDLNDETIVKTIISMAHNLKLKVIAEGVETKKHVDLLTSLNCNEAQGYYFSKPVSATELEKLLGYAID